MELPTDQLQAPSAPTRSIGTNDSGTTVLAAYGEALLKADTGALAAVEYLWLSGASEQACRVAGTLTSIKRLVVHDWRPRDLSTLGGLRQIKSLSIAGSAKLKSLLGIEQLGTLEELILFDCCGYVSVEQIGCLTRLKTLCIEGGFRKSLRLETLQPLEGLKGLENLRLASMRVADRSLAPLRALRNLRSTFITAQFAKGELRDLARALPLARGEFLDSNRDV